MITKKTKATQILIFDISMPNRICSKLPYYIEDYTIYPSNFHAKLVMVRPFNLWGGQSMEPKSYLLAIIKTPEGKE